MAQNIYDDPTFLAGYSRLPRSAEGLAGAPEWPALRALLPDMTGLRVVDLGCGFGWFCRWARDAGATHVLGLDVSEKMLARAKAETQDAAITYERMDLEELNLPKAGFDLAYSSLALHYIEDLGRLFATVHRALVPGAHFVFSIEHPIYMATRRPGWITDAKGRKTWPVDSYQMEGPRRTNWFVEGVLKYHRTLGTTLNLLIRNGFAIRHIEDFGPSETQIAAAPELAEERERPMFLLVAAERDAG
ncbi:class I SAM-dependent methyltransferase [Rhodoplanes sp. Z2-YC6860]|uniref:class I SAM-dependent methyltransferase n=1 Tax=Rhodoplanes sp. Z2-YC6860 TaxID=674703 RepID=UPI00078E55F5|nr:class I SAM-dependent methyltransferase [Rhodoplanes sp. Z2-YC6860]AMN42521.1 type 11 methyltransferase [Rhodoplanes sp. Z2-YC6860]